MGTDSSWPAALVTLAHGADDIAAWATRHALFERGPRQVEAERALPCPV